MLSEDFRRKANAIIAPFAWGAAVATTFWVVQDPDHRPYGIIVVLLIGIAITSSIIRLRYKLAKTMAEVFHAGMRVGWNTPVRESLRQRQETDAEENIKPQEVQKPPH